MAYYPLCFSEVDILSANVKISRFHKLMVDFVGNEWKFLEATVCGIGEKCVLLHWQCAGCLQGQLARDLLNQKGGIPRYWNLFFDINTHINE